MFARFSRPLRVVGGRRSFSDEVASVPIPGKSKGWPTPWITEEDATNYLFPLYSRGWYISSIAHEHSLLRTAGLACRFSFASSSPASNFVREIIELSEAENHHPSWLKLSHSIKSSNVQVCTTTHSALRPEWYPEEPLEKRALEGLTLRDLRFAALVSSLPASPTPSREIGPSPTRPTWDDLSATLRLWSTPPVTKPSKAKEEKISRTSKQAVCAACEGPHATSACPTRHTIQPPPCAVCRGPHWRVDCPVVEISRREKITVAQARVKIGRLNPEGESRVPTTPCPNCGGAHWKEDCRVPQAPPELLRRFELPVPPAGSGEKTS
ncbi:hypothetical protein B0H11DRAFT_1183301 [Mycena galericulata]|nr:hypothetical protein B0H11DRAFT_1183301 [Mycena galericulata]